MGNVAKALTTGRLRSLIILVLLIIIASLLTPVFLTTANLLNVLLEVAVTTILAIGETYVIILGEIDLSIGCILGLTGALSASILQKGNLFEALVLSLLIGLAAGALNGVLVTKGKMPSFIATLGTMTMFYGITLVFTGGNPIVINLPSFEWLGQGYFLAIPIPVWIMAVLVIVFGLLLHRTYFGRYIFATGGNIESSRLSGINVTKVKMICFSLAGVLAAVAGVIQTARLSSAEPTTGKGMEMDAITAVVLGGTSMVGGKGGLIGTIIGAIILGVLDDGMNLLNVSAFYQDVVKGVIIILAVLLDSNIDSITKIFGRKQKQNSMLASKK